MTAWYGHGTAYWRSGGVWILENVERCAVQFVSTEPPNSIKKLPFVCNWLPSNTHLTNHSLLSRTTVTSMLNGACGRSHTHIPPATCTRGADVPSQWVLKSINRTSTLPQWPLQGVITRRSPLTAAERGLALHLLSPSSQRPWHAATSSRTSLIIEQLTSTQLAWTISTEIGSLCMVRPPWSAH